MPSIKKYQKINKTYQIITIGCQMNRADSERLAAFLEKQGCRATDLKIADIVIINTCGVRQGAEDRVYGLVNEIKRHNPAVKIVISGCLSRRADVKKRLAGQADLFLPVSELTRLGKLLADLDKEAMINFRNDNRSDNRSDNRNDKVNGFRKDNMDVAETKNDFKPHFSLDEVRLKQGEKYLSVLPKRESRFVAYVPIGNGCNNFCAYCVVPYARGREVYRPAGEIIKEVTAAVKRGYQEIILIAQNVNSYRDEGYDFPKLLARLNKIPGKFWLRFVSSHPKDLSDELIRVIGRAKKVCPHLHLAVQSGDDKILRAMNRNYTAAHYRGLIKKARAARLGLAVTTDVIVGFPGETRAQFMNTIKLFKTVKFDLAYIAQYSPRPGTAAAKMKDNVRPAEKKRRAYVLNEVLKETALANNQKYLGRILEVLVEGRNRYGKYLGKSGSYQTVLVEGADGGVGVASIKADAALKKSGPGELIGKFVMVKIVKARAFGLEGEIIGAI